jgi:hypothetical protein
MDPENKKRTHDTSKNDGLCIVHQTCIYSLSVLNKRTSEQSTIMAWS